MLAFLQTPEERQPIHAGHVDVRDDDLNPWIAIEHFQRLNAVPRKLKREQAVSHMPPEFLADERSQVRLVVDK